MKPEISRTDLVEQKKQKKRKDQVKEHQDSKKLAAACLQTITMLCYSRLSTLDAAVEVDYLIELGALL